MTSLRDQAKGLQKRKPRDLDPEDDTVLNGDNSSDVEDSPKLDGREHYEQVDKSNLREPEQPQLDKKYGGVTISRSALRDEDDADPYAPVEEDEDEDPFARGSSSDDGSEVSDADMGSDIETEASDADDLRKGVQRASIRNGKDHGIHAATQSDAESDGEENESELQADSESDVDMKYIDESDVSNSSSASSPPGDSGPATGRQELHQLLKQDTARVAAGLSSQDDVKQGRAVKEQQTTYDRLLDARIKLQKGLAASNELPSDTIPDSDAKEAIARAEAAANSLWSTIDALRCTMLSSKQSSDNTKKRKRRLKAEALTPLHDIWEHSQSLEALSIPHRRNTLNHWSTRTRASAPSQPRSRFSSNAEPALTDVLDEYLRKETQKLAPSTIQSTLQTEPRTADQAPPAPSPMQFSDDGFYQSLLRDLIASRTNNPLITNGTTPLSSSSTTATGRPHPINNQRNRKNVDTKASKGRKIRYTVHEKLVSFMAPEDRSTWSEGARREFFGSMFGGRGGVTDGGEGDEEMDIDMGDGKEGPGMNGIGVKEEGVLRLFRS